MNQHFCILGSPAQSTPEMPGILLVLPLLHATARGLSFNTLSILNFSTLQGMVLKYCKKFGHLLGQGTEGSLRVPKKESMFLLMHLDIKNL